MRRFLGKVTLVVLLTFLVSVGLAFTTGDAGPIDSDPEEPAPQALAGDTADSGDQNAAGASTDDASAEAALDGGDDVATEASPDHLGDEDGTTDTDAEVLGAAESADEPLADTGLDASTLLLIGLGLVALGTGTRQATHRLVAIRP